MTSPQVNGEVASPAHQSAFIQHLLRYPLINDGVAGFKSNEYGQRSIKLGDSAYQALAAPVAPWFAKPCQYLEPYVRRADQLGDKTLDRFDERFPVVKKPTRDIVDGTTRLFLLPYSMGLEGRDHLLNIYTAEVKKSQQQGLVAQGKAAILTALVVSNETLAWFSSFLTAKKAEVATMAKNNLQQ